MPQRKTIPMGLIPTVCGAVKYMQSNNLSNVTSISDLKREGLELAKDAMRRALSRRVLEMTPTGNFRLKVISDKRMASNLVENTFAQCPEGNSKSKPKSKNINKKGSKLHKTNKCKCSTCDKITRPAKAPSIFNKPPSKTEKIIKKRLTRKKERKIKPKIIQYDLISDILSSEDGNTKVTTFKKKTQKNEQSGKNAEKKGGLPFRTEKIKNKKLTRKKEGKTKPKVQYDIISLSSSSEDGNEKATTNKKKRQKKEGSDKNTKTSSKQVKGNNKTREDSKSEKSDQNNKETQSNTKILSEQHRLRKRKRPASEEEETENNMQDMNP